MYHALCDVDDNNETIWLLEEDPECQIVFTTIAFTNRLNVKALLDSLSLGFRDSLGQVWQEKGRVGWVLLAASQGVIFAPPHEYIVAEKWIKGGY
jgi:hypothetical protein